MKKLDRGHLIWAQEVVEVLRSLSDGSIEPTDRYEGVCHALCELVEMGAEFVVDAFCEQWHEYSGDRGYPIPAVERHRCAYEVYYETDDIWEGDYGECRRRFCDYLADCVEECMAAWEAAHATVG